MANAPPSPPPGIPTPAALPPLELPTIVAQINGTFARMRTMPCKAGEDVKNPYAKVLLDDALERMRQHGTGELPLSPEQSLDLRKEIDRLSDLVYGPRPAMSAAYSPGEAAVLAERAEAQRRASNNVGLGFGGLLTAPALAARILGAPEAAVEGVAQISMNLAGAFGLRGARPSIPLPSRSMPALSTPLRPAAPAAARPGGPAAKPGAPAPPPPAAAPSLSTSIKPAKTLLDWKAVVPKKGPYRGQTREDHVREHNVDNPQKTDHGVFKVDGVDTTNRAWERAQDLGLKPDATGKLVVPMGEVVGSAGGKAAASGQLFTNTTIFVVPGTNQIITAYPGP